MKEHFSSCSHEKEIAQVAAAHVCYLVAESNFEPYSDNARLCLVGADHWKFPRTYASPQAIQVFIITLLSYSNYKWRPGNYDDAEFVLQTACSY